MSSKGRGRRKTNWRQVNLAPYDQALSLDDVVFNDAHLDKKGRNKSKKDVVPFEDDVKTRSEWKSIGKQVRMMLIPGSISAFASCMWVSLEIYTGHPIATFSKIVELALPFWDALPKEDQEAWAERAHCEKRRSHYIYVRNGQNTGQRKQTPRKKKGDRDEDYYDSDMSDTDELPSHPTRMLHIEDDEIDVVTTRSDTLPTRKSKEPLVVEPTVKQKLTTIEEIPAPPSFQETNGLRNVPPPPQAYRPSMTVVGSKRDPDPNLTMVAEQVVAPLSMPHQHPPYNPSIPGRGRGGYLPRRTSRGGFDMYPIAMSAATAPAPYSSRVDSTPYWQCASTPLMTSSILQTSHQHFRPPPSNYRTPMHFDD